jgi:hypothetical protein
MGTLKKSNAISEIEERYIEKYFHVFRAWKGSLGK